MRFIEAMVAAFIALYWLPVGISILGWGYGADGKASFLEACEARGGMATISIAPRYLCVKPDAIIDLGEGK